MTMIICARCGERNGDGSRFCGACDAFLDWEGTSAEQPQPRGVPANSQPQVVPQHPVPGPYTPRAPGPHGRQPVPQPVPQPAPQPVPRPQVGQAQVAQPTDEVRQRRYTPPPTVTERRPPQPGELICGQCGAGNAPTRKFCHSCGASLQDAPAVPEKWWRKLFRGRKGKRYEAGARPGREGVRARTGKAKPAVRRVMRWVRNVVALVVVLLGLLYGVVPSFRSTVNEQVLGLKKGVEHDLGLNPVPVRPTSVTSPTQLPGHDVAQAVDGFTNTYWAAAPGPAEPVLVLHFDKPTDIRQAILRIGIGQNFQSSARPQRLHLVYSTGNTFDIDLADTPNEQKVEVKNGAGAKDIEVHVVSTFKSLQGNDVAISEMEFFQPG
ncbi:MAG TPA: zinc ribbon domain-containing protein [Amycolatopsis sp.]|uniref:zinc ribbon domain-containing protein n=1 Tax=Amycolatopsis sp. TaxID=37632 RepID=UPI002B470D35|nr:zinc ribbon domain-containing protein [Amycolatopsis sp.]HKS44915.1 zinc ribbon domain-containing protein [Amycolatopsis sp.]